ncbi:unnamed protein product [Candidula unifasciata]|uniref:PiggyBac transposable element-derived protein domain-containing protein n=1 Tax=Candidula unifasciata TaxID=100452 RepID=A0A8S4A0U8_9EUPU|nr:unnamed protein product [Candidula unifasciata]
MSDDETQTCNRDDSDSASDCGAESDDSWLSRDAPVDNIATESSDSDDGIDEAGDVGTSVDRSGRGTRDQNISTAENVVWKWRKAAENELVEIDNLPPYQEQQGVMSDTTGFLPINFFKIFFPDTAIDLITREVNRYGENHLSQYTGSAKYKKLTWDNTDAVEISAFIGLHIGMGMCCKPAVSDYWSKNFWLNETAYSRAMSRNRYQLLHRNLHFNNNDVRNERGQPGYDPLFKLRPLLDIILPTYRENYTPGCELSIDESMVRFKGRIYFKQQYLPAKPTKWGFKLFVLTDAKTQYCLKLEIYTGKANNEGCVGTTSTLVKRLLDGYEFKGHILYCDSFYSSPALFQELKEMQIGACGTVSERRKHFPEMLKKKQLKLKKADNPVFCVTEDKSMLAVTWHDTKRVNLISTVHSNDVMDKTVRKRGAPEGRIINKPVLAEKYNQSMGGVDHFGQLAANYPYPHRSYKWYLPLYHFLVETALVNGHISYNTVNSTKKITAKKFRQDVSLALIGPAVLRHNVIPSRPQVTTSRLTERHFIEKYEKPKYKPDCKVCKAAGKRSQTCMYCPDCNTPLCLTPCFKLYHTVEDYQRSRQRLLQSSTATASTSVNE